MSNRPETSFGQRLWGALKILNVRLRFILLMVATGVIAAQWDTITAYWELWTRPAAPAVSAAVASEFYCPMHPSVIRDEPSQCPICGMPLSKRLKGEREALPEGTLARVQLSPQRLALGRIATSEVGFRPLAQEIRVAGTIEADETRVTRVAARTAGRIERLHVDYTGEAVARGQALAELYSPALVTAQQEYLTARDDARASEAEGRAAAAEAATALAEAARERLRLWGIDDAQLGALDRAGRPFLTLTLRAPSAGIVTRKSVVAGQYVMEGDELYTLVDLSRVWLNAYVSEAAMGEVRAGQTVRVAGGGAGAVSRASSQDGGGHRAPGSALEGEIEFVSPAVDPATRTLPVRAGLPNPDLALRPGMYVTATILAGATGGEARAPAGERWICTMCPEVVSHEPGSCPTCGMFLVRAAAAPSGMALAVPEGAVILTGERRIVYLEREPGLFDAVEVSLGRPVEGHYPVLAGLVPGDRVVTQGAFLVDAEVRLNPAAAGSYFGASGNP